MDKKGYAKLQTQVRHDRSEMLQLFKELYPEKYAELQARAKSEVDEPTAPRPVTSYGTQVLTEAAILRVIRPDPNIRDYYIHTKDTFGKEHMLFESGYTPEAAALRGQERWPQYAHEIIRIEPCECPLCV